MDIQPDSKRSYFICICAAITNLIYFGFTLSFGVYLPAITEHFNESKEKAAWVGSLAIGLTFVAGPITVPLVKRFGYRPVTMTSGLICSISLAISSFARHLIVLYVFYGIIYGITGGIILNTSLTSTKRYFKTKWPSATGIITSGPSIGIMIWSPCNELLIETIGWRNALRVMSGMMLLICAAAATYVPIKTQTNSNEGQENRLLQQDGSCLAILQTFASLLTNARYSIGLLAIVICYFGSYSPHIHLVQFAKDLGVPNNKAAEIFIYFSIANALSRIIFGQIHTRFSTVSLLCSLQLAIFLSGLTVILLSLAKTYVHLVVLFGVMYGIGNGAFILYQSVFFMTEVPPEKSDFGIGLGNMACAITMCGGPPFTGYLADTTGSYILSFYIAGGIMVFAAFLPCVLFVMNQITRWRNNKRSQVQIIFL